MALDCICRIVTAFAKYSLQDKTKLEHYLTPGARQIVGPKPGISSLGTTWTVCHLHQAPVDLIARTLHVQTSRVRVMQPLVAMQKQP